MPKNAKGAPSNPGGKLLCCSAWGSQRKAEEEADFPQLKPARVGTKGVGRRGTHSHKSKKTHKLGLRSTFLERHIDQVRLARLSEHALTYLRTRFAVSDVARSFFAGSCRMLGMHVAMVR